LRAVVGDGRPQHTAARATAPGDQDTADLEEWAERQVAGFPPWSEDWWRRINAGLGYRLDDPADPQGQD
jgi:hypothetical protein